MSVTRINEFQAVEGKGAELRELVGSFVPMIESSPGCLSCKVLVSRTDPDRIVVLESWEDAEAHKAATQMIPSATLQKAMALLAESPKGDYYGE